MDISTPPATELRSCFDAQHRATRAAPEVPLALRLDRLQRISTLLDTHGAALAAAVQADFGVRAPQLTEVADIFVLRTLLSHTRKHLRGWMKPQKVSTPIYLQPSRGELQRQPVGVVGVISPWNYPVQLALAPVITALAAGNRVMLKPSELTPRTSALMAELLHQQFAADELLVVLGDASVASDFASLPFDHLLFTGSTPVGRKVAQAAAANLTPTTLELGGKSPCIVGLGADMDDAALKIAHGKLLNAGQTCIAPDYVLLPQGQEQAFEQAYGRAVARLFPSIMGNGDYAAIISPRHLARLQHLLDEAQAQGAVVRQIAPAGERSEKGTGRQMLPTLVTQTRDAMTLMQEEIFGPILPVLPYAALDDAITYINDRPRPLALYWFGPDTAARDAVLRRTVSGGVTVNDTLMHIAHENLPFGGVGDSGWGAYHGETGFLRFTQQKPVFFQSRWAAGSLFYPPYGKRLEQVMGMLKRIL